VVVEPSAPPAAMGQLVIDCPVPLRVYRNAPSGLAAMSVG
jgi:hypothetical protein